MWGVHREVTFARSSAPCVVLRSSSREWVRAVGSLNDASGVGLRLAGVDRVSSERSLLDVQCCLTSRLSASGYLPYQMALESNPAGCSVCGGGDEDRSPAQDASLLGQSPQQWKLCVMAQGPSLEAVTKSRSRRPLARNKSLSCADVRVGDPASVKKRSVAYARRDGATRRQFRTLMKHAWRRNS